MKPVRCANCQALQRRVHDLQAENERLRRQLDEATRAGKRQQFQVEIPRKPIHRRFNIHIGQCRPCHRRLQGRHPFLRQPGLDAAN